MFNGFYDKIVLVHSFFTKHNVEYMLIGGTAAWLHGFERMTMVFDGTKAMKPDIDIWYNPSYSNYWKLLDSLVDMGKDMTEYKTEKCPDPKHSYFKLEFDEYTLDLIPTMVGLPKFKDCYLNKERVLIQEQHVHVIGLANLIDNKIALGRPKDLIDVEHLKRLL